MKSFLRAMSFLFLFLGFMSFNFEDMPYLYQKRGINAVSKLGDNSEEVKKIQEALKSKEYFCNEITGIFDEHTQDAVLIFQQENNLKDDGIVNEDTLRALGLEGLVNNAPLETRKGSPKENSNQQEKSKSSKEKPKSNAPSKKEEQKKDSTQKKNPTSKFSDADISLIARIISAEARGEPYSGQVAVGAVIMNRIEHPSFPDTLSGVVYQKGAFSCLDDGQVNQLVSDSSKRAAIDAINGVDPSGGAIYYYNPAKTSNAWMNSRPVITVIGAHRFCS